MKINNEDVTASNFTFAKMIRTTIIKEKKIRKTHQIPHLNIQQRQRRQPVHDGLQVPSSPVQVPSSELVLSKRKILQLSHSSIMIVIAAFSISTSLAFSSSRRIHSAFVTTTHGQKQGGLSLHQRQYQHLNQHLNQHFHKEQQRHSSSSFAKISQNNLGPSSSYTSRLYSESTEQQEGKKTGEKTIDNEEWNTLVSAFKMYKAAYGDLKVPSRFVVPSMPPWPKSGWGLKLGQRVAAIRSTGKYVDGNNDRRKVLDDMGFLWRLRAPSPDKKIDVSFDQIYDALITYRQEVQPQGSLIVPPNFIVPSYAPWPEATRGMPLGKKIPSVRTKAYLKANPGATEKLEKIGFEFDGKAAANDARFHAVYDALVQYKKLNGDLLVPQPFIIPDSEDWPEELWGLRLGARVNAIRSQGTFVKNNPERKSQLDDIGFEWELPAVGKKRGRKKKAENEALAGPAPPGLLDSDFNLQGDKNLNAADSNDESQSPSFSSASLNSNDYQYDDDSQDPPVWGFEDEEAEQKAAIMQQAAEEEFAPPKNLNVTLTEAAARAVEVGVIESLGQGKRVVKGAINKVIPWFNDDFGEDFVFEDVIEALKTYKEIHGSFESLHANLEFVVPEPTFASDLDVEAAAAAADAIAKAESDGEDSDALIAAEIERMELVMSGEIDDDDETPNNSGTKWPEHLSGMKLGTITARICDGSLEVKHLPDRKKALDDIGFDWGNEKKFIDIPFEKAMCAMFAYFLIRGDLFVYEDFIMPGEKPWPISFAGYELGKTVKRIRELQNFFEAYHPEKVRLLRRVEFVWFPELALPLNPEDGEESWEDIFVEGVGHPFYQMNEPPVSTIEKLQAEGPFDDDDKTKSWYDYNEVADFWERGDITDVGKESERPNWRPAEWLWFNGFDQLAQEHEQRYGISPGLELLRLIEGFHNGTITEKEFDERGKAALIKYEEEQLRVDAISAGIDVSKDDTMESIIEKIKEDPQFLALDDDPEYKRLIEAELDADEAREALIRKMDMEEMGIEEEELDFDDDEDDDDIDLEDEYEYDTEDDDDDSSYLEDKVDDDDDDEEDDELDLDDEDDFIIDEEEI